MLNPITLSILLPLGSDVDALRRRWSEIRTAAASLDCGWEALAVSAGATPGVVAELAALARRYDELRLLVVDEPVGTSAAMAIGVTAARGQILVACDLAGDYRVEQITKLVERLTRLDVVLGCRRASGVLKWLRHVALAPRRWLLADDSTDPDCVFWAARREALAEILWFDGAHRHLPTLVARQGYRVGSAYVEVESDQPLASRGMFAAAIDLMGVWWLGRRCRPASVCEWPGGMPPGATRRIDSLGGDQQRIDAPHATEGVEGLAAPHRLSDPREARQHRSESTGAAHFGGPGH